MTFRQRLTNFVRFFTHKLHYISLLLIVLGGIYLMFKFLIGKNPLFGFILLNISIFSLFLIVPIWRWFSRKFAPAIISFSNTHPLGKKIVAGGSFSYFEYAEDEELIGFGEPISRFVSLLIAFLGLSTTLIKVATKWSDKVTLASPVESMESVVMWGILLVLVPLLLTPIVPIIWAMEDLRLKAWNAKKGINWRVADKYRSKFNGFIAISAVTAGLSLTKDQGADPISNGLSFLLLLWHGTSLLVLPLSLMTVAYYVQFRGSVTDETRKRIDIPVILTELIYDAKRYRQMEDKLKKYEKEEEKRRKKKERERGDGILGVLGIKKKKVVEDEEGEETEDNSEQEEEEIPDNKFLSNERITEDNYEELEAKYFGESSTKKKKKKRSKSKKPSPVNAVQGVFTNVSKSIGRLFGKKEEE